MANNPDTLINFLSEALGYPNGKTMMYDLYTIKGKGREHISTYLGVSHQTVANWRDRFGLEIHLPGGNQRGKEQLGISQS